MCYNTFQNVRWHYQIDKNWPFIIPTLSQQLLDYFWQNKYLNKCAKTFNISSSVQLSCCTIILLFEEQSKNLYGKIQNLPLNVYQQHSAIVLKVPPHPKSYIKINWLYKLFFFLKYLQFQKSFRRCGSNKAPRVLLRFVNCSQEV